MNKNKVMYWVSTGLLTLIVLFSCWLYLFNHQEAIAAFEHLGYPVYLIYPLAIAKLLGLIAVWVRRPALLKNLSYAGFFYDFVLALTAHLTAGDGGFAPALVALIAVIISFLCEQKVVTA